MKWSLEITESDMEASLERTDNLAGVTEQVSREGRAMSQIFSSSSASLCLAQIRRESCLLCEWSASEARELPPYPWKQFGMKNKVDP